MKINFKRVGGLTLPETLVVTAVLAILVCVVLLPALAKAKPHGITCVNRLKQIGIAYLVWEGDNGNMFPMEYYTNAAGGPLYADGKEMFRYYLAMSNEISNPKVLICPMDTNRHAATNFLTDFKGNSNTSYFIGLAANDRYPTRILSGDYNITNGTALRNGALELTTNRIAGWTEELHKERGNIGMADGSVQQLNARSLNAALERTGLATNRLLMPVY